MLLFISDLFDFLLHVDLILLNLLGHLFKQSLLPMSRDVEYSLLQIVDPFNLGVIV